MVVRKSCSAGRSQIERRINPKFRIKTFLEEKGGRREKRGLPYKLIPISLSLLHFPRKVFLRFFEANYYFLTIIRENQSFLRPCALRAIAVNGSLPGLPWQRDLRDQIFCGLSAFNAVTWVASFLLASSGTVRSSPTTIWSSDVPSRSVITPSASSRISMPAA